MNNMWILAQTGADEASSQVTSKPLNEQGEAMSKVPSDSNIVTTEGEPRKSLFPPWILLVFMVLMLFLLFRGPRKKQQEQKKMVQSLEKNDRVRTIGGIVGTVVDIKGDDITLKIDESNNTKMHIVSSAIGKNLTKDKN